MDIITKDLHLKTKGFSDIHNITPKVDATVKETGFNDGFCHIHVVGSTASISTMEFEPALVKDIKEKLEDFASQNMKSHHSETWGDDNGFSHIRATFMGPGITVPIRDGKCILGTWQQIVVLDHDNQSRKRHVIVQVVGK
ncbi:secondary thiamine-phosphate synthase enzyme YjbQ [Rhodohalobacter sulfatireducens]|uniref:Secondary thiamine-phosphate synthase enzyme YjbQ n=1 Tax=Rhodohalobacter sulfatireducens TaxID=2911366 RepID=A0ABS9KDI6_9BACT|nr:secondary thiamine-phosphate synthase enzyme YjbQ [Rhodohalobacter sulfatireducens]MCG2588912.1 secondary thiamine-phosphate synthase enzyme YjbQ [Rhodohalobacter sulfatireducens]